MRFLLLFVALLRGCGGVLQASAPQAVDIPLEQAVAQFNAEAQEDAIGKTQPILTVEEVVAAIRAFARHDKPPMNDAHYAAFQKIADTRTLPAGSHFDWITRWTVRNGEGVDEFDVWWVDLFLQQNPAAPDPLIGPGYNFRIRDTKIGPRPAAGKNAAK